MYPFLRMLRARRVARSQPPIRPGAVHVSHHICWPVDLDPWVELNNGRTLTLFDLGRLGMMERTGFVETVRKMGWGMTIAGSSVRYRRRVRAFDRMEMRSRLTGNDARFFYMEQSIWVRGECCSHALLRVAMTDGHIVPPARAAEVLPGLTDLPPLPDWIRAWAEADAQRPWPPMQDSGLS